RSWSLSYEDGCSDEFSLPTGPGRLRALAATGSALLPEGPPPRAPDLQPPLVGRRPPRPRGVGVFPAPAARSAAPPADPGAAGAHAGAGQADRDGDGRGRPQGGDRARRLRLHEGARRVPLALR